MGKKKSSKSVFFTDEDDDCIKFAPVTNDVHYALFQINVFNKSWREMTIERNRNRMYVVLNGIRHLYGEYKTFKECEKIYNFTIKSMNELLHDTYNRDNWNYAEFVFDEKIKNEKDYVRNFMKFFYIT